MANGALEESNYIPQKQTFRQADEPGNPENGSIWIDTSGSNEETNIYDAEGQTWELLIARGPDTPEYGVEGSLWRDTGNAELKQNNGSTWDKVGVDLDPVNNALIDMTVDIAELDYAQGLNADSSDNIWIDPFVDTSKIASSSNVAITTGQNGNIALSFILNSEAILPDRTDGSSAKHGVVINPNSDLSSVVVKPYAETQGSGGIEIYDVNGNLLSSKSDCNAGEYNVISASLNASTKYYVVLDNNWSNYKRSYNPSYPYTSSDLDIVNGVTWDGSNFNTESLNVHNIKAVGSGSYPSSGTIKTVPIDKGYTPSALQPDMDVETDSDTTVPVRAFDGNGNEQTWMESEMGQSKSVNFTDSSFQLELQPQTSNSAKTPQINDVGVNVD